jgi:hypothetical protein
LVPTSMATERTVSFTALAGSYVSSSDGGCTLTLRSDRTSLITCKNRPPRSGEAWPFASGFAVPTGESVEYIALRFAPSRSTAEPNWPPSVQDPTVPLIISQPAYTESLWLVPLRWGSRLYLIRDGDIVGFCGEVQRGTEPRTVAMGIHFRRSGDHRKPAGRHSPAECSWRDLSFDARELAACDQVP